MKYGWLIYTEKSKVKKMDDICNNKKFKWMADAMLAYDIKLDIFIKEKFVIESDTEVRFKYEGKNIKKPDFVFMRTFDYVICTQLQLLGIQVINTIDAMHKTRNKVLTSQILKSNNIRTPKFLFSHKRDYLMLTEYFGNLSFVMKGINGSKGSSVYLISNEEEFITVSNKLVGEVMYQEFVETSYGRDIRVYILGGKVIGQTMRVSQEGFKSNVSLGGNFIPYAIDEELKEISEQSAKALELDFCGLDLLLLEEGYTVCEVNGNALFPPANTVIPLDIADEVCKYINTKIYGDK